MTESLDLAGFGAALQRRIRRAGVSRKEIARRAGVSDATILKLERGLTPSPGLDVLTRLASAFGVPIDDLLRDFGVQVTAEQHEELGRIVAALEPYDQELVVELARTVQETRQAYDSPEPGKPVPLPQRHRRREPIPEPLEGAAFSESEVIEEAGTETDTQGHTA